VPLQAYKKNTHWQREMQNTESRVFLRSRLVRPSAFLRFLSASDKTRSKMFLLSKSLTVSNMEQYSYRVRQTWQDSHTRQLLNLYNSTAPCFKCHRCHCCMRNLDCFWRRFAKLRFGVACAFFVGRLSNTKNKRTASLANDVA
jgi:hypothetical protein